MAEDVKFPVKLTHPKTKGRTRAATRSSLRVLERRGWVRESSEPAPKAPPKPEKSS